MTDPRVVTFGCRLNAFESEVIRDRARAAGLGDVAIVNTCAVTGEAVRQARQAIRRLRRERPDRPIVVTGCAAQLEPERFAAMPEVDRVLGNADKLSEEAFRRNADAVVVSDIMTIAETAGHLIGGFEGRSRAFVQIQQGCDHRCTFCIIPFARGPNRSVAADVVVDQVRTLVANGYPEVVLTGVDICSYGADLDAGTMSIATLGALVRAILARVPELRRLRLSSLDPAAMDDALFDAFAGEARLMPHAHFSVQAGDDLVLKRMKRRHLRGQAIAVAKRLRGLRPDIALGADLIAGFPTETEEMFAGSLDLVDEMGLSFLHVFPFSARDGTPAARMPQVSAPVRRERAARLRVRGELALGRYLAGQIGKVTDVLVEREDQGRCPDYAPVRLARPAQIGAVASVRLTGVAANHLIGERVG